MKHRFTSVTRKSARYKTFLLINEFKIDIGVNANNFLPGIVKIIL